MKRTNKKVEVRNGTRTIIRTVYLNEFGREYFKYDGKECYIYQKENGRYNAPWFNGVEYITD